MDIKMKSIIPIHEKYCIVYHWMDIFISMVQSMCFCLLLLWIFGLPVAIFNSWDLMMKNVRNQWRGNINTNNNKLNKIETNVFAILYQHPVDIVIFNFGFFQKWIDYVGWSSKQNIYKWFTSSYTVRSNT